MKREKKTEFISFRVSPKEKAKFKRFAEQQGCSVGKLIRSAVAYMLAVSGSQERGSENGN